MNTSAPCFVHYADLLQRFPFGERDTAWLETYNASLAPAYALRADANAYKALAYEQRISATRTIPTRVGSVHDWLNAMVWAKFPLTKAAINARHVAEGGTGAGNARSRVRDALTLFDESGVVICGGDTRLRATHAAHDWLALFEHARGRWRDELRVIVFGHGLLESLATRPHKALTGKALWFLPEKHENVPTPQLDAVLAAYFSAADASAIDQLLPLPIAGVPGWHADNDKAAFYDDHRVFRPLSKMQK
jgi:hypothetical protein